MKWALLALASLLTVLIAFQTAEGQDVSIPVTSAYLTLARGNSWGSGGACGSGSGCGVNNNYVWSPPTPDSTVCVAITNNNPTSSHTFTLTLSQTLDSSVQQFTSNPGPWASVPIVGTSFPAVVGISSTISFFFRSSSAAKLALQVTGSTPQAGTPDTANIVVVQPSTASFCGGASNGTNIVNVVGATGNLNVIPGSLRQPVLVGGLQSSNGSLTGNVAQYFAVDSVTSGIYVGSTNGLTGPRVTAYANEDLSITPSGLTGVVPISTYGYADDTATPAPLIAMRTSGRYGVATSGQWQWASDSDGTAGTVPLAAYLTNTTIVNPGAGALIAGVNIAGTNPTLNLNRLVISCSAACDVNINRVSNVGTTCPAGTTQKAFSSAVGAASQDTALSGACVTNPTVTNVVFHWFLAAGVPFTYDMSGYWQTGTGAGFDVVEGAALTGTATVTMEWSERD